MSSLTKVGFFKRDLNQHKFKTNEDIAISTNYRQLSYFFAVLLLLAMPGILAAQSTQDTTETISFFLDCRTWGCDQSYIREEINFVNFVRDQTDADVHLMVTSQGTGGGGQEFTLQFIGQNQFSNQQDTLRYNSYQGDTEDMRREGLVRTIKAGLLPYLSDTQIIRRLTITFDEDETSQQAAQQAEEDDPWNKWIFEVGFNAGMNGEETEKSYDLRGDVQAERVTRDLKIELFADRDYEYEEFERDDSNFIAETYSSRYDGFIAKSLTDHWSIGIFTEAFESSRNNYDLRIGGAPAVEYNIFPYSEYTRREITFRYDYLMTHNNYSDITIYNETEEFLMEHQLTAQMNFTQPWGQVEGDIEASAYMHDLSKNRVEFSAELDFQVTRGLSFNIEGEYSLINDQLSLRQGEVEDEEQLLDLREQATGFEYQLSFGFEYTFGSIFSSEVNPRFGGRF